MNTYKHNKSMKNMIIIVVMFMIVIFCISQKLPMQKLKITAVTTAEEFDISGTTDLYYLKTPDFTGTNTVVIKFMAVKNTSENLFTFHGKGQYVHLGCDELCVKHTFVSFGKFLHIKLTLNAAQTDLKLEDGTPFDITRYSLVPVITMEE